MQDNHDIEYVKKLLSGEIINRVPIAYEPEHIMVPIASAENHIIAASYNGSQKVELSKSDNPNAYYLEFGFPLRINFVYYPNREEEIKLFAKQATTASEGPRDKYPGCVALLDSRINLLETQINTLQYSFRLDKIGRDVNHHMDASSYLLEQLYMYSQKDAVWNYIIISKQGKGNMIFTREFLEEKAYSTEISSFGNMTLLRADPPKS